MWDTTKKCNQHDTSGSFYWSHQNLCYDEHQNTTISDFSTVINTIADINSWVKDQVYSINTRTCKVGLARASVLSDLYRLLQNAAKTPKFKFTSHQTWKNNICSLSLTFSMSPCLVSACGKNEGIGCMGWLCSPSNGVLICIAWGSPSEASAGFLMNMVKVLPELPISPIVIRPVSDGGAMCVRALSLPWYMVSI